MGFQLMFNTFHSQYLCPKWLKAETFVNDEVRYIVSTLLFQTNKIGRLV